jgi:hypothetical protein
VKPFRRDVTFTQRARGRALCPKCGRYGLPKWRMAGGCVYWHVGYYSEAGFFPTDYCESNPTPQATP